MTLTDESAVVQRSPAGSMPVAPLLLTSRSAWRRFTSRNRQPLTSTGSPGVSRRAGQPLDEPGERGRPRFPGQPGAEAEVDSRGEGDVHAFVAVEVEPARLGEAPLVTVCGRDDRCHVPSGRNLDAGQLDGASSSRRGTIPTGEAHRAASSIAGRARERSACSSRSCSGRLSRPSRACAIRSRSSCSPAARKTFKLPRICCSVRSPPSSRHSAMFRNRDESGALGGGPSCPLMTRSIARSIFVGFVGRQPGLEGVSDVVDPPAQVGGGHVEPGDCLERLGCERLEVRVHELCGAVRRERVDQFVGDLGYESAHEGLDRLRLAGSLHRRSHTCVLGAVREQDAAGDIGERSRCNACAERLVVLQHRCHVVPAGDEPEVVDRRHVRDRVVLAELPPDGKRVRVQLVEGNLDRPQTPPRTVAASAARQRLGRTLT